MDLIDKGEVFSNATCLFFASWNKQPRKFCVISYRQNVEFWVILIRLMEKQPTSLTTCPDVYDFFLRLILIWIFGRMKFWQLINRLFNWNMTKWMKLLFGAMGASLFAELFFLIFLIWGTVWGPISSVKAYFFVGNAGKPIFTLANVKYFCGFAQLKILLVCCLDIFRSPNFLFIYFSIIYTYIHTVYLYLVLFSDCMSSDVWLNFLIYSTTQAVFTALVEYSMRLADFDCISSECLRCVLQAGGELRDRWRRVHPEKCPLHALPWLQREAWHTASQRGQLREGHFSRKKIKDI